MAGSTSQGCWRMIVSIGAAACQYSVMLAVSVAKGFSTHFRHFVANQCVSCLLQTSLCFAQVAGFPFFLRGGTTFHGQQPGQWLQEAWKTSDKSPGCPRMRSWGHGFIHSCLRQALEASTEYWLWQQLVEQKPPSVVFRSTG